MRLTPIQILEPKLVALLDGSGLHWTLEQGSRHAKVLIEGRLALVVSNTRARKNEKGGSRHAANARAAVRRAIRSLTEKGERHDAAA